MRHGKMLLLSCMVGLALMGCGKKQNEAPALENKTETVSDKAADVKYPEKGVNFMIPYAAGGGTDSLMRLLTASMEKDLGQSMIIANKAGGLGQVGLTELAAAKADGYTIGALSNLDHILVLLTGENVSYDYDSFEYIGAINTTVNVLMANEASGFKSMDELVEYAKANPGKVTVAVSGKTHIAELSMLEQAAGIDLTTVMQGSGGDSLNAVLGGHVDCAVLDKKFVSQVEGQAVTPLASFGGERIATIEDLPTMKELGYDVATETYRVIVAPKGTPQEILDKLEASMKLVTSDAKFQETMAGMNEIYRFLGQKEVKERLDRDYQAMVEMLEKNPDAFQ